MRKQITLLLASFMMVCTAAMAQNTGTLKGKVTDKISKQPLPFVNVVVFLNGNLVTGGATDIDGEYTIKPIDPGSYDVQFSFVGYQSQELKGVPITAGKIQFANMEMTEGEELKTLEISEFKVPLIDKDGGASGGTVTREELARMPSRAGKYSGQREKSHAAKVIFANDAQMQFPFSFWLLLKKKPCKYVSIALQVRESMRNIFEPQKSWPLNWSKPRWRWCMAAAVPA